MSASPPSFSSFPPVFSSFPDLEPGPSKPKPGPSTPPRKKHRGESAGETKRADKGKHEKRTKEREGERSERKKKSRKRRGSSHTYSDEEGHSAAQGTALYSADSDSATRLFYSDRKGDILNVKYGNLHVGDVPKHYLLASECCIRLLDDG